MTVKEMKEEAKRRGLAKYSALRRDELIDLLKDKGKGPAKKESASKAPGKIYVTDTNTKKKYELRPSRRDNSPKVDGEDKWFARSGLGPLIQGEDASQYIVSYFDNPAGLEVALKWIVQSCKKAYMGKAIVLKLYHQPENMLDNGKYFIRYGNEKIEFGEKLINETRLEMKVGKELISDGEELIIRGEELIEEAGNQFLTDSGKVPKITNLDKGKRFRISLVGLDLQGVGHWGGCIYDRDKKTVSFYDSMQECRDSKFLSDYSFFFETYLKYAFPPGTTVEIQGCGVCNINPIRSKDRQPSGGFTPYLEEYARDEGGGYDKKIDWKNVKELDLTKKDKDFLSIYDFDSQHHFCFMESLLFVSEILARECSHKIFSSNKPALFQTKRFIWALVHSIPKELYKENKIVMFKTPTDKTYFDEYFRYVFDPDTNQPRCIIRCEDFDGTQAPFADIVGVLKFAYS